MVSDKETNESNIQIAKDLAKRLHLRHTTFPLFLYDEISWFAPVEVLRACQKLIEEKEAQDRKRGEHNV